MGGKRNWYIVDGYRPPMQPATDVRYEGHESIMILNTNDKDAHVKISVYFSDRDPREDIELVVPAKRIFAFRSSDKEILDGLELGINEQYSMRITSDIDIVVQYGRLDVQQNNMAYIASLGYAE